MDKESEEYLDKIDRLRQAVEANLEILHYPEEMACEHDKILDAADEEGAVLGQNGTRYDQDFGVLLASQKLGWMYRLDFCERCGLVEIWSMEYNPGEIGFFAPSG